MAINKSNSPRRFSCQDWPDVEQISTATDTLEGVGLHRLQDGDGARGRDALHRARPTQAGRWRPAFRQCLR